MVATAAVQEEIEVLKVLLQLRQTDLALPMAAAAGRNEAIAVLLSCGFDLHADQELALRLAVANGQLTTIRYLFEDGADWRQLHGQFGGPDARKAFAGHAKAIGDIELTSSLV
jgi:hypothetical protein